MSGFNVGRLPDERSARRIREEVGTLADAESIALLQSKPDGSCAVSRKDLRIDVKENLGCKKGLGLNLNF